MRQYLDDCLQCRQLEQAALGASKSYHELMRDLEAAHILHDHGSTTLLAARLDKASRARDSAIAELTIHAHTHTQKKLAVVLQLARRQSA